MHTFANQKMSNAANNIDDDLMRLNNFFVHFVNEINVRRYSNDVRILPTSNTVRIYKYSNAMLKHMPHDALRRYDKAKHYYTVKKLLN